MDSTFEAFLRSWPLDPWVVIPILLTAAVYLRGWNDLRQRSRRFGPVQLSCFLAGLACLFLALASPIESFASLLLQVHMLQHLLLMIVAPPLLWLGAPLLPLLRGLPESIRRYWIAPLFRVPAIRETFNFLTQLRVAWVIFAAATWIWHAPPLYERALASDAWHAVEHGCFLFAGLLFWYPVVRPYPARPAFSRWLLLPYLILADVQNTALAALFTFSGRVFYPHYAAVPRLWGISAVADQTTAGLLMWVPGSIAFLGPLVVIARNLLYPPRRARSAQRRLDRETERERQESPAPARIALPVLSPATNQTDLLRWPILSRFLHWRHARLTLQIPLFLLAVAIINDGLRGPPAAPMNLAGVLPWIHWRGLVVLGLLIAGNVFCLACPFMAPRKLAKRWLPARRAWPRWLRSKWLAVALLILFFAAYELFALWASPWWTAWIVLGYFIAAFAVDGIFRGASFCKYVCPIGQFHFVHSMLSPLEIRVREPARCVSCSTKECIRGSALVPGCELGLFVPRKTGNMDCTLCLDCVHACPHDNIGLIAVPPGSSLLSRNAITRLTRRVDVAALVLVLVFAAFAGAAAMVAPVIESAADAGTVLGLGSARPVQVTTLVLSITLLPLMAVAAPAALGRWWSGAAGTWLESATRFSFALLPLGFGMWLAHFGFHFFTGWDTAWPVLERFAADFGLGLGQPSWRCGCCAAAGTSLLRLEILFLDAGLLGSLYLGYRTALDRTPQTGQALRLFAPWAALMLVLFACGIWILFQPMEMRGMMQM
jgi:cytochrome c oxidase assembly factor CtaG/ferredoxin